MREIWDSINKFYFTNFVVVLVIILSIILMFFIQFKVEKLQDLITKNRVEINDYEDQLRLLEVEWVYLTRPERLRQISGRFLKENGYALASQIKGSEEISKIENANYKTNFENDKNFSDIAKSKDI